MMLRQFWMAAVVVAGLGVAQTQAGVRGGEFTGSVNDVFSGDTFDVTSDFAEEGDAFNENFDGSDFPGTYTENDLFILSIWNATYDSDPDNLAFGICFASTATVYVIYPANPTSETATVFVGVLTKSGPANLP